MQLSRHARTLIQEVHARAAAAAPPSLPAAAAPAFKHQRLIRRTCEDSLHVLGVADPTWPTAAVRAGEDRRLAAAVVQATSVIDLDHLAEGLENRRLPGIALEEGDHLDVVQPRIELRKIEGRFVHTCP